MYVQFSHTKEHACGDGTNARLLASVSKGQGVIAVHSGSENGFDWNALLMFILGTKSGDYQSRNKFGNYGRYLRTNLIPNLPPNSVLAVNYAAYNNTQFNSGELCRLQ
jgi:hypothetical protein